MNTKLGSRATKSAKGQTNWEALKAMPDSSVTFTEEAPQTSPSDWADAVAHHGLPLRAKKNRLRCGWMPMSSNGFGPLAAVGKPA